MYPVPVHKLSMYARTHFDPLLEATRAAVEVLSIPRYPQLGEEKPKHVVDQLKAVLQSFSQEGIQS
jgi:dTDP-4-amino-4,6-dideoxygalactose transaminase